MTDEQKKYIEENIDLIEKSKWDEFFTRAPMGTGGVLYGAGVTWMQELQYVPESAFSNYTDLTSITIPEGITSIGSFAFYNCDSLTSVTISDSVTSIRYSAFRNCTSLTSVIIGNSVTSIDCNAFNSCDSLTSVTIPNSVTSIGDYAFYGCDKVEIKYGSTVEAWKDLIGTNSKVFQHTTYICNCTDGVVKKAR